MWRVWLVLMVLILVFLAGCGSTASLTATLTVEPATATNSPSVTPLPVVTDTPTMEPSLTSTPEPSSTTVSATPPGPTIPPEITLTPGIAATYSAFIARQTQMVGTEVAQLGPSAHLMGFMIFYSNPVGTPVQNWHEVPVMSQATAGQEFQSDIYSYKAAVTLAQAVQFYASASNSQKWNCIQATGKAGSGSGMTHSSTFMCGGFTIIVTSFDNDPKQVLVVINKAP
jgi:hypothetical protein